MLNTPALVAAQELLLGRLVGLARAATNNPKTEDTDRLLAAGLAATLDPAKDAAALTALAEAVTADKNRVAPNCAHCVARCGNTDDYDLARLWAAEGETRALKVLLLSELRALGADLYTLMQLGLCCEAASAFVQKGLFVLAEDWPKEYLLPVLTECGAAHAACRNVLTGAI